MADIQLATAKPGKPGRKVLSTKVDLTPMVDLGFLLITFFIITTNLSEKKAISLTAPADTKERGTVVGNSRALTVIPGKDNKLFYYHGELKEALKNNEYGYTTYDYAKGLGEIIRDKKAAMNAFKPGSDTSLMLIVCPTAHSSYQNLVAVIDEVLINNIEYYAVTDQFKEQEDALVSNGKIDRDF